MIILELEGDDGATEADNPDSDRDENCSGVCNIFTLESLKMFNWMNNGHVLVKGDDKNVNFSLNYFNNTFRILLTLHSSNL